MVIKYPFTLSGRLGKLNEKMEFCNKIDKLTTHSFIAKSPAKYSNFYFPVRKQNDCITLRIYFIKLMNYKLRFKNIHCKIYGIVLFLYSSCI